MPSLLQVLHDATVRGATEIVLEPDRPPQARGPEQVETIPTVLSEGELYDALGAVLKPEQQAELAVGNVVEFHLFDGTAKWHLVAEPGSEGVIVRGRAGEGPPQHNPEVGAPLDLPPLRRGERDKNAAVPRAPGPLLVKRPRDTAWDLPPVTTTSSSSPLPKPTPRSNPAPPVSVNAATETRMPSWFETTGPASAPNATQRFAPTPAPTPASAPVDAQSVDFALLRRPPTGEPPAVLDDAIEPSNGQSKPRPDDPFGPLARELGVGSICLVRGHGMGERLARHYDRYALILERREAQAIREDRRVNTFVLRLEDPSELLGWALRRAEEGARVIVEMAALTAAGARRGFLGTQAGPTAGAWLDALPVYWLAEDDGRWQLTKVC
jgi:hypothetical protein